MRDNTYERQTAALAQAFKDQLDRTQRHVRGGDRPPYAQRFTPTMARDPMLTNQVANSLDQQGQHDQAARIRQMGAQYQGAQGHQMFASGPPSPLGASMGPPNRGGP